jgi:hypothetical protein
MLRTETETDGDGTEETGYGEIDATRKLAGSTMVSLGYHREGDGVEFEKTEHTDLMSTSAVGVTVASAAFVLAGVALSTIPAALL